MSHRSSQGWWATIALGTWVAVGIQPELSTAAETNQALVGVLEEVPGVYVGESSHFGVRALFINDAGGWHAFPHECANAECLALITARYPKETRWAISFEGRMLGNVSARTPRDFGFYAHIGIQNLSDGQQAPTLGTQSADYSGFNGTVVYRPLLATTGAAKPTPAHGGWKLQAVSPRDAERVWPLFQRLVPLIDDCRLDAHGEYVPSDGRAPQVNELEIANKWANRFGGALMHARIRPDVFKECDGPMSHRSDYWYYREPSGAIWLLPGQDIQSGDSEPQADLIMPLDFVDILGDGRDEALFLMAGYDAGGYALFYEDFHKAAIFTWIYH